MDVASKKVELIKLLSAVEDEAVLSRVENALKEKGEENFVINENEFWHLISKVDWNESMNQKKIQPLIESLVTYPESSIVTFYDLLSEKLFLLDQEKFAKELEKKNKHFSSDEFLYARCAVVAKGKNYFDQVVSNEVIFPANLYLEDLLEVPEQAFKMKTGNDLDHLPIYIFETGFNPEGWGDKTVKL